MRGVENIVVLLQFICITHMVNIFDIFSLKNTNLFIFVSVTINPDYTPNISFMICIIAYWEKFSHSK